EVPSAALTADAIAAQVDFLSIGSNDLTQYTLAVDRGNDLIQNLYQDFHPGVLQLIERTISAAHRHKKHVSICGELGMNPIATPVLVGLGIDEISVSPSQVRALAARIRLIDKKECEELAKGIISECVT